MNKEQILGFVRHILTFGGGIAVGQGWLSEEMMMQLVGAGVTIIGFVWSFFFAPEKKLPSA